MGEGNEIQTRCYDKNFTERDMASLEPFIDDLKVSGIEITADDRENGIRNEWDKFKDTYGGALTLIREMGMSEDPPRRINFTNLDTEHNAILNQMCGEGSAEKVKEIFGKMQTFIRREGTDENGNELDLGKRFSKDVKYADLYTRVYEVDDIPFVKLEQDVKSVGMIPLSKKLSDSVRTDSLVRNFNDLKHAEAATEALLKGSKAHDLKTKIENYIIFAEESSMYGGQKQRSRAIRHTVGTVYLLSKQDKWADVIGLDKGPNRLAISDLQRIYGPQAEALSRDELRGHLDEIRTLLADAFDQKDAEAMYHELEELLEVRGKDFMKLRGERTGLY